MAGERASETVRRRDVPAGADRDATLRRMRADAREGDGLCLRPSQQPSDQPHMGTAFTPAKTSPASWDAFSDVDAFVDAVLAELAAMAADGTRSTRRGPKPPLTGAALRKAILAIWCVAFCGLQWRAIGQLCDIPFGTLYTLFARWTRLGLWRRLLNRLILAWRQACGDTADPSAVIIDSRSCRSAPTCFDCGFDGGKKIKGIKIHLAVDKYGFPLAINVSPANRHDSKGIVPVLHQLAGRGFKGTALGDLSYRGQRLSKAGAWHHPPTQRWRARRNLHSGGYSVDRRALPGLDQQLPPVEHHLRADRGASRRFHRDRFHFDPLPPLDPPCDPGNQRLTSTNSFLSAWGLWRGPDQGADDPWP